MATTTVNLLTALTAADSGDKIPIWDISAGQYKAITKANLLGTALAMSSLTFQQVGFPSFSQITIVPANPLATSFLLLTEEDAVFNGVRDTTHKLGFNINSEDTDIGALWLQWEQTFNVGGTAQQGEFWIGYRQPASLGGANLRPYQLNGYYYQDKVDVSYDADNHYFTTRGGTGVTINSSGFSTNGILTFLTNNVTAITQQGASGVGGINLLKLNSSNVFEVGQSTYITRIMGPLHTSAGENLYIMGAAIDSISYNECVWFGHASLSTTRRHVVAASVSSTGAAAGLNFNINTGAENVRNTTLALRGNARVGINDAAPDGSLHVQTADAAAVPVLLLEQLDVSEEILEIVSTAGTGNAIEAVGGKTLTTTHWIKVTINGDARYIPAGTIA